MSRAFASVSCVSSIVFLLACAGGQTGTPDADPSGPPGDGAAGDGAVGDGQPDEDEQDGVMGDGMSDDGDADENVDEDVIGDPDDPEPPRRAPVADLPDFRRAGYRAGQPLPGAAQVMRVLDAAALGVVADDHQDDTAALQAAIDSVGDIAGRDYEHLVVLKLPAGRIDLSDEIHVDQSFLILRGQGSDADLPSATRIVVRPSLTMRLDVLTEDGSAPGYDQIREGPASGGWMWPGRGAFRVQTRQVHEDYASDHQAAPGPRKELFEGSVNFHWKSGLKVNQDETFAARAGESVVRLDSVAGLAVGQTLWVGAANSRTFYEDTGVHQPEYWLNGHMRAQVFEVRALDASARSVTLDLPLEFDVPAHSRSDGSSAIAGDDAYESKVLPLVMVEGVGFEKFHLSYDLAGLPLLSGESFAASEDDARHEYGNLAPEYALHGIVFKWAQNSWLRDVHVHMAGSHPVVTEVARHLQVEYSRFTGAWNKGKGGNGYLRGSRVWNSLYRHNVLRDLRHFTFQWSASGNVATHNDMDADFNLHGGWERFNLIECNVIRVPAGHAPGQCTTNCGSEGGGTDSGNWYPLWWGAGAKAGKWSGATGPRNILYHNVMAKQLTADGPYEPYTPYDASSAAEFYPVLQLGWSSTGSYVPLSRAGMPIADWSGNETLDYAMAPNTGVDGSLQVEGASLFYELP